MIMNETDKQIHEAEFGKIDERVAKSRLNGWVMWFFPTYEIVEERMGGTLYWMIYQKQFGLKRFFERWNTPETAEIRLKELTT